MANFAVSVSEELLAKCNAVLVKLQRDGEKKADALNRAFDIALTTLEDEQLKYNGVDISQLFFRKYPIIIYVHCKWKRRKEDCI